MFLFLRLTGHFVLQSVHLISPSFLVLCKPPDLEKNEGVNKKIKLDFAYLGVITLELSVDTGLLGAAKHKLSSPAVGTTSVWRTKG